MALIAFYNIKYNKTLTFIKLINIKDKNIFIIKTSIVYSYNSFLFILIFNQKNFLN